ncbi:hypothetical protein, partial [Photobacterium sp. DNB22_13_2]
VSRITRRCAGRLRSCRTTTSPDIAWLRGWTLVSVLLVHPLFHPLPGLTHFLCLAKESKQRKARPR